MSWQLVARKDVRDAYRNRLLPGGIALFVVVYGVAAYAFSRAAGAQASMDGLLALLYPVSSVLLPAFGLMIAYRIVAEKREDGRLRLLLGLPISRGEFVFGSYLGRACVLLVSYLAGIVALVAVLVVTGAPIDGGQLGAFAVVTALLGGAYLGIAIATSALLRSTRWTSLLAFGIFLLFIFVWRFVPDGLAYLLKGFEAPATQPDWAAFVGGLSPSVAYERLMGEYVFQAGASADPGSWYLDPRIGAVVLLVWITLVPLAGFARFRSTDL